MKKHTIPLLLILFASVFSIFGFNDTFAQSDEPQSTREPFIKTDLDSFTPNLNIILFGNVGGLEVPITLKISCDGIPDSTMYPRLSRGEHQNFEVNESGYFRLSLTTIDFTCDKQTSTVTASIQGTDASTSFQMIKWDENIKSTVSASTDKTFYQKGDNVIFSGKVTNYEFPNVISYVLDDPNGYHISMSQSLLPNSDGVFSTNFGSNGLFRLDGDYEIKYTYADDPSTKSKFTFHYSIPVESIPETTKPISEPVDTLEVTDEPETTTSEDEIEEEEITSQFIEESLEIQRNDKVESSETSITNERKSDSKDYIVTRNLVKQDKGIDVVSKQLDSQTQHKVKFLDSKISREQSQYDEYLKQYEYYDGKTLSPKDEQKFQKVVGKLNSQNEKIDSLIDERNMVVLQSDGVSEVIEEKTKPVQASKIIEEKPQKQVSCFLFWCW